MKPINIKNVLIFDENNKQAASVAFKNGLNIVTSDETSRGKSSVLRSIPYAFGCESNFDNIMNASSKYFAVTFQFDKDEYTIVRSSRIYLIFKNNNYYQRFDSNYTALSTFYEKEFSFSVYLTNRNGEYELTPVAYSFLPYVIDQDISWKTSKTNPFKLSSQYLNGVIDLFYYHLGILNKRYYELKNKLFGIENNLKKSKNKTSDLLAKIKEYKEICTTTSISVNEEDAKSNIAILKEALNTLINQESELNKQILEKENFISKYKAELKVTEELISNITKKTKNGYTKCPNCGFEFIDSYRDIYNKELLDDNRRFILKEIESINQELESIKTEYSNVAKLIAQKTNFYKESNASFYDYIRAQAINETLDKLEKEFAQESIASDALKKEFDVATQELSQYDQQKTKSNALFKEIYFDFLNSLGIHSVTKDTIRPFEKVQISGNKYIRSTLAFFLSFLKLKDIYNNDLFLMPLIIDSPFEGDPDDMNREDIVKTLYDFYLSNGLNCQMIIGVRKGRDCFADSDNINFIDLLTEEDHLLDEKTYIENSSVINRYLSMIKNIKLSKNNEF